MTSYSDRRLQQEAKALANELWDAVEQGNTKLYDFKSHIVTRVMEKVTTAVTAMLVFDCRSNPEVRHCVGFDAGRPVFGTIGDERVAAHEALESLFKSLNHNVRGPNGSLKPGATEACLLVGRAESVEMPPRSQSETVLFIDNGYWHRGTAQLRRVAHQPADHFLGFTTKAIHLPALTIVEDRQQPLFDPDRREAVTEIGGLNDGLDLFDVTSVAYGAEITLRLRNELTQEREWYRPPVDWSMERALNYLADALRDGWNIPRPNVGGIYRGRQARQWLRDSLNRAHIASQDAADQVMPDETVPPDWSKAPGGAEALRIYGDDSNENQN